MELCTVPRAIISSNLPYQRPFTPNNTSLRWRTYLPLNCSSIYRTNRGLQYYTNSSLKSTTSEETSSGSSQYVKEETDGVITVEDVRYVEMNESGEESPMDGQTQPFDFLDKLNIEIDSGDPYTIFLFGGGSLVTLWLATAIVGAIDSIPVFPNLMKVVGLGYTLWFGTRYLLFKKNRDELAAKIEEIKQQVVGSSDD